MNLYQPILCLFVFLTLVYLAMANEFAPNSIADPSATSPLLNESNENDNWEQEISSRSSDYYNKPHTYSHRPLPYRSYNKINSRDSTSYSSGPPIHVANAGNSYASLAGTELSSSYPSPSYHQSYPSAAYPSPPSYHVPSYGHEDLVAHDYEEHEEKKKLVKKHLALGISLPLILVPLAVIGILALLNFRAVFTVLVIRSLCSNSAFRTNFGQLCTFVDNINKRSSSEGGGFKNLARETHKYSRLMSLLNSDKLVAMDNLNNATQDN